MAKDLLYVKKRNIFYLNGKLEKNDKFIICSNVDMN